VIGNFIEKEKYFLATSYVLPTNIGIEVPNKHVNALGRHFPMHHSKQKFGNIFVQLCNFLLDKDKTNGTFNDRIYI
jgi:hypothetical protein